MSREKKQDKTQTVDRPPQDDQVHWQRTPASQFNKSQMTADYQHTTVKLHPLKKTTYI
jgi:hypothetical protein